MDGKFQVLSSVIQQKDFFTVAMVMEETNLSRQLVTYHLNRMVEQGYVESVPYGLASITYNVIDKDALVKVMALTGAPGSNKSFATRFLPDTKLFISAITLVKQARAMELSYSRELYVAVLEELNDSIKSFRSAKKNLTETRIARLKAIKIATRNGDGWEDWQRDYQEKLKEFKILFKSDVLEDELSDRHGELPSRE